MACAIALGFMWAVCDIRYGVWEVVSCMALPHPPLSHEGGLPEPFWGRTVAPAVIRRKGGLFEGSSLEEGLMGSL